MLSSERQLVLRLEISLLRFAFYSLLIQLYLAGTSSAKSMLSISLTTAKQRLLFILSFQFALFSTGNLDAFIDVIIEPFVPADAAFHGEQRRWQVLLGPNVPTAEEEVVHLMFISLSNNRTNAMMTTTTTSHSHTTTDILPESPRSTSNTLRL